MPALFNFLRQPKENQAKILENLPLSLAQANQEGIIELANVQFLKICGLKRAVGRNLLDLSSIKKLNLKPQIDKGLKGQAFNVEVSPNLPTERVKNFYRFQGIPVTSGLLLIVEDITAQKRLIEDAQNYIQKLQQEQSRFLASINSLGRGFVIIDIKNNILIKNNAIDSILGLKNLEGNVLLKGDIESIEKRLKASFDLKSAWEKSLAEKKTVDIKEIPFENKFFRLFLAPIMMGEEAIGVVILIEDITEAKILDRAKDEFFSIASHELRTPLTAIRGNTAMIEQYFADKLQDQELKGMITDIHESSIRLITLVNDFLDVSRLEQGKIIFKQEEFETTSLVKEVTNELKKTAQEKNLYLRLTPPASSLPLAAADRDRTKQILYNLVDNAIKFTEKGGVEIKIDLRDKSLAVNITDTGKGIAQSQQNLLFRKFQQAGENILTRDVTRGTGLGLYISKLLTEGMGGKIWLEKSEENRGSTFVFTLPVAKS